MSQYRACDRCGRSIDDTIKHRGGWNQAGSLGGSLGGSYAGSAVGGAFGIVGSLAGAVGGAVLGSRVGQQGAQASCNTIDKVQAGKMCEACKTAETTRSSGYKDFGGGSAGNRLGTSYSSSAGAVPSAPFPSAQPQQPTVGDRVSGVASTASGHIQRGAATAATGISGAASWVKQKTVGGEESKGASTGAASSANGTFVPFSGGGYSLGEAPAAARPSAPPAPVAAPVRRPMTQMEQDEAYARRLQDELMMQ